MRKPLDPAVEQALDKLKNRLGQLLLKILEEKKLENRKFNQNNLAEMLDFGSSEISEYLDCKRVPTLSKLLKLAMFREQNIESLIAELLGRSIEPLNPLFRSKTRSDRSTPPPNSSSCSIWFCNSQEPVPKSWTQPAKSPRPWSIC